MFKFYADAVTESIPSVGGQDGGRPTPWDRPIGPGPRPIIFDGCVRTNPIGPIGLIKEPVIGIITHP